MPRKKAVEITEETPEVVEDYIAESVDGLKVRHDERGAYYQLTAKSKRRYFDESSEYDKERARKIALRG